VEEESFPAFSEDPTKLTFHYDIAREYEASQTYIKLYNIPHKNRFLEMNEISHLKERAFSVCEGEMSEIVT
jgi:hypothetical protein